MEMIGERIFIKSLFSGILLNILNHSFEKIWIYNSCLLLYGLIENFTTEKAHFNTDYAMFLNSLSFEEIERVDLYDENDTVLFEMKKYPEISYVMDRFVFYDGDYYDQYDGYYYKISEDFVKLCTANGLLFK